jgi:L,D-peptidoglycan transpeptidase YkuD (ErfK/YbiS/YcfS/YnhG family)
MTQIIVQPQSWTTGLGRVIAGGQSFVCTLGRAGVTTDKVEGDGKTPIGIFPFRRLFYRADRIARPETGIPCEILTPDIGWCEKVDHPDYNRAIRLPHPAVTDHMTREDHLYDICVIIGHNDDPVVAGKGSAIFMHLSRPDLGPTAGCIGLAMDDLLFVLKQCGKDSTIAILPPA